MDKYCIVVPTYNEAENLPSLVAEIFKMVEDYNFKIIVVDDNSPDGTGQLAENLKKQYNLEVIHRTEKLGLGLAYVEGLRGALMEGADYIFSMDADWSHQPKYLPDFIDAVKDNALVLGSRYINGGSTTNWSWDRRLVSYLGNLFARSLLKVPIKDLTGGFKCYRRSCLESINLDELKSLGYNFQIETTYRVFKSGQKIKEIPINFVERKRGVSKFNLKIITEAFYRVIKFSLKK